ncbi:HAD-IB family hydrolase [Bacillus sp. EB106-08-02-XG196]|uniref:HAD family hydrolase n=1 Tax=Bacillus sp. EB106-08-02-XG196 TaxID=2737049 RepID=UPI0015C45FC5|nr:HAD-IB family hydrolase [Bacillus sp. EB106-08-02-XG196]NWQ44027.1 HAD-IB family hydrolase [Bacillus sp. EB106-08-02-XG196]
MKVAIFDFDGTLFPNETFPLLMGHLKNHPLHFQKYRNFFLRLLPVYLAYKCKLYPEQKMKEYSMWSYIAAFGTSPKSEIDQFFSQIGESMSQNLSEPVLHRLEQHRREGYYTMLVSGAYEPLLHSVTKNVNFDCISGSSIPYHDEKLSKTTSIKYIYGERKSDFINAHLSHTEVDWQNSFAYGDSYTDLNVLELVGNPVAVNPEPRLLEVANHKKWEII